MSKQKLEISPEWNLWPRWLSDFEGQVSILTRDFSRVELRVADPKLTNMVVSILTRDFSRVEPLGSVLTRPN